MSANTYLENCNRDLTPSPFLDELALEDLNVPCGIGDIVKYCLSLDQASSSSSNFTLLDSHFFSSDLEGIPPSLATEVFHSCLQEPVNKAGPSSSNHVISPDTQDIHKQLQKSARGAPIGLNLSLTR